MTLHHVLALLMAASVAWDSALAGPSVLGGVLQASRAHLNTGPVSAGATVYDGDRFSTETGGLLVLRGEAVMLELAADSAAVMRSGPKGAQGMETELTRGTLIFSTTRAAALEVTVQAAIVQPATDARTIAQVSVAGPKELRVCAWRGALQFSYKGESETIAEGAAYRVILDPPEGDSNKTQTAGRSRRAFVFIVIGAQIGTLIYELHDVFESSDRP